MTFLFALSNPSPQYSMTRHNAGHYVLIKLKSFVSIKKLDELRNSTVLKYELNNSVGYFVFSKSFMNLSGSVLDEALRQTRTSLNEVCLLHDDMDLPLGKFKLKFGGGSGGHKGVESVIAALSDDKFWRLKIGISKTSEKLERTNWLLSKFSPYEIEKIELAITQLRDAFEELLKGEFLRAQNKFNRYSPNSEQNL